MALAYQKGRLALDIPIQQWLLDALTPSGIELLPLTPEITLKAVNLSPVHKDSFDRIIIGTALEYKAKRLFGTWYGSIGGHKSTKSLSGKRFN
jgi:PIN domain nuclease of toxin-antitoxin system